MCIVVLVIKYRLKDSVFWLFLGYFIMKVYKSSIREEE